MLMLPTGIRTARSQAPHATIIHQAPPKSTSLEPPNTNYQPPGPISASETTEKWNKRLKHMKGFTNYGLIVLLLLVRDTITTTGGWRCGDAGISERHQHQTTNAGRQPTLLG